MTSAQVLAAIEAAGGVGDAAVKVVNNVNVLFGKVEEVKAKARWLAITVVNMSPTQNLLVDDSWFDSGRFWTAPFGAIQPGTSLTFYVCNKDGSIFTGVSGGFGLSVDKVGSSKFMEGSNTQWVCTFSNPFAGSIKCLTRWKEFGIKPLFDQMQEAYTIYDSRCGCYRKDDNHIFYIWKDPAHSW